jgi:hypothetical protein
MACSSPVGAEKEDESGEANQYLANQDLKLSRPDAESRKPNPNMMELKVVCDCGQKYKFDVEPVNNQMPFTVACPICKRDGTAKANAMLQQMAVFKPVGSATSSAPAPAPVLSAAPAPASVAPPPIGAAAPAPVGAPRLRINVAAHAETAPAPSAAPATIAPPGGGAPPPIGARPRMGMAAAAASAGGEPAKKSSFAMGLLGAVIGALVGGILYYVVLRVTGVNFLRYFLALGVGGLTGWLANLLGKGEGSKELGGLAAVFTLIGIIGAQYFSMMDTFHQAEDKYGDVTQAIEDGGYSDNVKEAKRVVTAIPNGTDAEIRMYIAKEQTEPGQAPKLEQVSSDEIQQFRNEELTNYQDLASGKLTKEAYWAKNNFDPKAAKKALDTGETALGGIAIILAVLKAGIISMIFGAGLAFKLSSNA